MSTSAEIEAVSTFLSDASPILPGPGPVEVEVLVVRGSQSKWSKLHIKGVSSSASVAVFKEQVAEELMATAGPPRSGPDSIQLLIGGALVGDSLLSDYGALSSAARSIWAVAFYTQVSPEVSSAPEPERPAPSAEEAPKRPPILCRDSDGARVSATTEEAKAMQSGESMEVDVRATIFWGLRGNRRSCKLPVSRHATVGQLEDKLVEWMGLPPTELTVQFNGALLDHDCVLSDHDVSPGSVLEVLAWYDTCL